MHLPTASHGPQSSYRSDTWNNITQIDCELVLRRCLLKPRPKPKSSATIAITGMFRTLLPADLEVAVPTAESSAAYAFVNRNLERIKNPPGERGETTDGMKHL